MGRFRIALLFAAAFLASAGCRSPFRATAPGQPARSQAAAPDEADPSRNTAGRARPAGGLETREDSSETGDPDIQLTAAEEPAGSTASDLDRHDAVTRRMIDEELRDATPQERDQLLSDLKGLQPAMVREILKMRRLVRQMGQDAPGREHVATATDASEDPFSDDVQPAGATASSADQSYTPPRASAGLGSVDPWSDRRARESAPPAVWGDGRRSFDGSGPAGDPQQRTSAASSSWGTPPADRRAAVVGGPNQPSSYGHSTNYMPAAGVPVRSASYGTAGAGSVETDDTSAPPQAVPSKQTPGILSTASRDESVARVQPQAAASIHNPEDERAGAASYSGSALGDIGTSTLNPAVPGAAGPAWEPELQRLVARAETDVAQMRLGEQPSEADKRRYIENHVYLRMLYLMAGREERALTAIPAIDAADQEFWQQTLWAVANYFDADGIPESDDRASQTIAQLRTAIRHLQENARLELRNVNFCHKIASFGTYERFDRDEFSPGQPVLVYAEVANFKSEPAVEGQFRTLLKSTVEIYTPGGELIERMAFPATEDLCRNYRRDYFHSYEFTIPQRIALGPHVMKLIVEDQLSRKTAEYTLNFSVR